MERAAIALTSGSKVTAEGMVCPEMILLEPKAAFARVYTHNFLCCRRYSTSAVRSESRSVGEASDESHRLGDLIEDPKFNKSTEGVLHGLRWTAPTSPTFSGGLDTSRGQESLSCGATCS